MEFITDPEVYLKGQRIVKIYENYNTSAYRDGLYQVYGAIELGNGKLVGIVHVTKLRDDTYCNLDSIMDNDRNKVSDLVGQEIVDVTVWENAKHKGDVLKSESYIELALANGKRIFMGTYLSEPSDSCEFGDFHVETVFCWLSHEEMTSWRSFHEVVEK